MKSFSSKRRAFTVVELLVVIAILCVLSILGFPFFAQMVFFTVCGWIWGLYRLVAGLIHEPVIREFPVRNPRKYDNEIRFKRQEDRSRLTRKLYLRRISKKSPALNISSDPYKKVFNNIDRLSLNVSQRKLAELFCSLERDCRDEHGENWEKHYRDEKAFIDWKIAEIGEGSTARHVPFYSVDDQGGTVP